MRYCSLLDSNTLINIKNRNGLRIANSNSVSVYLQRENLRKYLSSGLTDYFLFNSYDKKFLIGKIIDRCENIETIDGVKLFFDADKDKKIFIESAEGKIREFFKNARKFIA
jgi:hypothetical protein